MIGKKLSATKEQWEMIEKIEDSLGVTFTGISMSDAAEFILKFYDEYKAKGKW